MVQTLFDRLLPRLKTDGPASKVSPIARTKRLRPRAARADPRGFEIGPHRPGAKPSAGQHEIKDVTEGDVFDATRELPKKFWKRAWRRWRRAKWPWSRWRRAWAAAGRRARARSRRCIRSANSADGIARSLKCTWPRAGASAGLAGQPLPHIFTTSYMTHQPTEAFLAREKFYGYPGPLLLSPGRTVGLRLIPMERDLRFSWEEMPQQMLDEQQQKVRDSLRARAHRLGAQAGEGSDYTDNVPLQCLHPVGHWFEVPNLLRNGVLARLLEQRPNLKHLMLHNIDTAGRGRGPGDARPAHRARRRPFL
jgi:hypothetical protein